MKEIIDLQGAENQSGQKNVQSIDNLSFKRQSGEVKEKELFEILSKLKNSGSMKPQLETILEEKNSFNLATMLRNAMKSQGNFAMNSQINLNPNAKVFEPVEAQKKESDGNLNNIEFLMQLSKFYLTQKTFYVKFNRLI